jgi:hypothetical protein
MQIQRDYSFEKEFKKLLKKYRSLEDDLKILTTLIIETPMGDGSKHWVALKQDGRKVIMKKRMMCRAVKGAQFRVVYYYDGRQVDLSFIEIYYKGDKESENKDRVKNIWREKTSLDE